ncbi:MAG: hypothetical protein IH948_01860 [Bacteroidetes bacterium]|nr:hypothetical protein [Bacteroidota bacterium]
MWGVSDLTGIEAFTALTWLDCELNSFTSLDVRNGNNINMTIATIIIGFVMKLENTIKQDFLSLQHSHPRYG